MMQSSMPVVGPTTVEPSDVASRAYAIVSKLPFLSGTPEPLLWRISSAFELVVLETNAVLVRQGDRGDDLFIVEQGQLKAFVERPDGTQVEVGTINPGQPIGEINLIGGGLRTATVKAAGPCVVLRLQRAAFDKLAEEVPELVASAQQVTRKRLYALQFRSALPEVFGPLDAEAVAEFEQAVQWVPLARGEALFREGDPCDGWYLVLAGRLRAVTRHAETGQEQPVGEIGARESLGEVAFITGERRTATVYAVRDTLVARFPIDAFHGIAMRHPRVLLAIAKRLVDLQQRAARPKPAPKHLVVAVAPASSSPAARGFVRSLVAALSAIGPTRLVNAAVLEQEGILANADRLPREHPGWLRFSIWLEEQGSSLSFVVLETDVEPTGWTYRALGQADHVVLVADAREPKTPGRLEAELLGSAQAPIHRARRTLVFVHPVDTRRPSGTEEWLAVRHVNDHAHVREHSAQDAGRVARLITGRANGLVLGGGGARGFAHLGVFKALRELDIPVDVIGGTSMGAIMAGQLALGLDLEELYELNRRIIDIKPFNEYTVPMVALLKTKGIERSARMAFGDTRIEDLWLPYFAVSSNLTTAEMVVHETGPVWLATRASGSLPGIAVPVVIDGSLLVDGGVINNLPGDVMRRKNGGGPVIAVNVSPDEDLTMNREEFPSQWGLFWNRVLPWTEQVTVPTITNILMRTIVLASANRTAQVRSSVDLYLRLPVDRFGMLEFESMKELVELGYRTTMETAAAWENGVPPWGRAAASPS